MTRDEKEGHLFTCTGALLLIASLVKNFPQQVIGYKAQIKCLKLVSLGPVDLVSIDEQI